MKRYADSKILIIDDEQPICDTLLEITTAWGMKADSANDPVQALERIKANGYDIVLLDVHLPVFSGLDLIPNISQYCPSAKAIVMTGYADKETAVQALRLGAFEFLEKPFELELLSHVIKRAVEARDAEEKQLRLIEQLKKSEAELTQHKEDMEYLNKQLMDTNKALTVFAQNIDRERDDVQKRIVIKLRSVVAPAIEKLKRDAKLVHYGEELDEIIRQMIDELTDDLSADGRIVSILSFTELRVATLIKNGLTTDEIANQLHISASTVRTHRKNIRKKLRINNAQYSLRNYLLNKSEPRIAGEKRVSL